MAFSLQEALEQVRSEKIKDRQQGLEALEHIFSDPHNVAELDAKGDGKPWLKTFQSLFLCVLAEKANCLKKGSWKDAQPIALVRLERAAQTLRSLVEKSASLLQRKTVKALVTHILQMLEHRGALFRPVASAYVAALVTLFQHPHHVDHLDEEDWILASTISFGTILDRDLSVNIRDVQRPELHDVVSQQSPARSLSSNSSRGLSLDDAAFASCIQCLLASSTAPLLGPDGLAKALLHDFSTFLSSFTAESSAHLPMLRALLHLVETLELNATEDVIVFAIIAHDAVLSLWKTKSRPLKTLLLTYLAVVTPLLIAYTQQNPIETLSKEFASSITLKQQASQNLASIYSLLLQDSESRWGFEPMRCTSIILGGTDLNRANVHSTDDCSLFIKSSFRAGPTFADQDVVVWIKLQLQSDILTHLIKTESVTPAATSDSTLATVPPSMLATTPDLFDSHLNTVHAPRKRSASPVKSSPFKRMRLEAEGDSTSALHPRADELLGIVCSSGSSSNAHSMVRLCSLQLLVFSLLDDTHSWSDDRARSELVTASLPTLLDLVSDTHSEVASWAMIGLAAVIHLMGKEVARVGAPILSFLSLNSVQVWALASRKLASPDLTRYAAYLLGECLSSPILLEDQRSASMASLLNDFEVQGPATLYDSVCHLACSLLRYTTSSGMLNHVQPRQKICSWLVSVLGSGPTLFSSPDLASGSCLASLHDVFDLVTLVASEEAVDHLEIFSGRALLVEDEVLMLLRRRKRTHALRMFVLGSDAASGADGPSNRQQHKHSPASGPVGGTRAAGPYETAELRRIHTLLQRKLAALSQPTGSESSVHNPTDVGSIVVRPMIDTLTSVEQNVDTVRLALLALHVSVLGDSTTKSDYVDLARAASKLLQQALARSCQNDAPTRKERLLVLQELDVIAPFSLWSANSDVEIANLIAAAGQRSGLVDTPATTSLHFSRDHCSTRLQDEDKRRNQSLLAIWTKLKELSTHDAILDRVFELLRQEIGEDESDPMEAQRTAAQKDDFDDPLTTDPVATPSCSMCGSTKACHGSAVVRTVVNVAVRLIVGARRLLSADPSEPIHDDALVTALFECPAGGLSILAPVLLHAYEQGVLFLSQLDLSDVLERIGLDLLGPYRFARDPGMRIAAIRVVSCIFASECGGAKAQADVAERMLKLASFFAEQLYRPKWNAPWEIKLASVSFVAHCLKVDPTTALWQSGRQANLPANALLRTSLDDDIRVSVLGQPFVAVLFDRQDLDEKATSSLYETYRSALPSDASSPQAVFTRAVSLANVAVISSLARLEAQFHLLEIVLATGSLSGIVRRLIGGVAARLGFFDAAALFENFAGPLAWGIVTNSYDLLRLPWRVVGYQTEQICFERNFSAFACMLLAAQMQDSHQQLENLAQLTGRSQPQALEECLPFLFAFHLGSNVETEVQAQAPSATAVSQAAVAEIARLAAVEDKTQLKQAFLIMPDRIVSNLLCLCYDREPDTSSIERLDVETAYQLDELIPSSELRGLAPRIHEPSRPFFPAAAIYQSLQALEAADAKPFDPAVAFHVLQHTFHGITTAHFANDQFRLIAALRLYLAVCGDSVWKDDLNVGIVLRSIEALLPQMHLQAELRPLTISACRAACEIADMASATVPCILHWILILHHRDQEMGHTAEISSSLGSAWLLELVDRVGAVSRQALADLVLLWPYPLSQSSYSATEIAITPSDFRRTLMAYREMPISLASLERIRACLRRTSAADVRALGGSTLASLMQRLAKSDRGALHVADESQRRIVVISIIAMLSMHSEILRHDDGVSPKNFVSHDRAAVEAMLSSTPRDIWQAVQAASTLLLLQQTQLADVKRSHRAFATLRFILSVMPELVKSGQIKWPRLARKALERYRFAQAVIPPCLSSSPIRSLPMRELRELSSQFNAWIRQIATLLCSMLSSGGQEANFFSSVGEMLSEDAMAAQHFLPLLLLAFTAGDDEMQHAEHTEGHFAACRKSIGQHMTDVLQAKEADPQCWKAIVEGLLEVREWTSQNRDPDTTYYWFEVNPDLVAGRCIDCGMHTAAVLFIEHGRPTQTESDAEAQSNGAPHERRQRSDLVFKAYANVSDPDAFYGIIDGPVHELLIKRLHHEGQWHRALQYHAAEYEASSTGSRSASATATANVGHSLNMLGFNRLFHLVEASDHTISPNKHKHSELSSSSRPSAAWDLPGGHATRSGTSEGLQRVLKVLRLSGTEAHVEAELKTALESALQKFGERTVLFSGALQDAQGETLALQQLHDWRSIAQRLGVDEAISHFKGYWAQLEIPENFELAERVLTARQSVVQALRQRQQAEQIGDLMGTSTLELANLERSLLVALSVRARDHSKLQTAINATIRAQIVEAEIEDEAAIAEEELAAVLWEQQEHSSAIQLLGQIADALPTTNKSPARQRHRKAILLTTLAQWRATARSQHPREIDKTLFEPALSLTSGSVPVVASPGQKAPQQQQAEIAYRWAKFAEEHFRNSNNEEISRLQLYIARRRDEIVQNQRECERTASRTERNRLLQFQRQAEKILRQDEAHLEELEASKTLFLRRSMVMYSRSLATSDEHDDAIARLVSMWFEFADDVELNRLLESCLRPIPSHKFLQLMHQLSARLSDSSGFFPGSGPHSFQTNLGSLLLRICQDHPFHALYSIFALIKTGADTKAADQRGSKGRVSRESNAQLPSQQVLRSIAAEKIWNQVKRQAPLSKRIQAFEEACLSYVEWAEYDLTTRPDRYFQGNGSIKKGGLRMPPSGELRLSRLRNLHVPVATADLEIDVSCRYDNFTSITRYSDTFTTAGGIHLPKISECLGSDGRRYKQLFKRDDDLRQDAVMQQVFRLVNSVLRVDRRTRERELQVRTYSVIPLGPQCGLLEFVVNTMPLGEVLVAMHARYRADDLTPAQARSKIREAQPLPAAEKIDVFHDVCRLMRPAFRYFFTETQKVPREWFATRLRYTRSVSTNSIVGHILGLGDRHVSNILLDRQSGELVHIDFGVAFDQGKLLPIPELVPFRLTRDLVDGMGMHGVEGTFRRCSEETLRVLRSHQDVIKTVLEVFKHDPLFAWTSNPIKVLRAQEMETESPSNRVEPRGPTGTSRATASAGRAGGRISASSTSPAETRAPTPAPVGVGAVGGLDELVGMGTAELSADRAITSVISKLSSSLSVEYTVNDLIQQATDAGNLASIFHGWQAAL
ncbi:hypothetical protein BCV70DRAFT_90358 [Testicularia cyperi]|uniref:Serine/threonine-protein kinase TEL1 n=1 Tax=Testicularia cyperi TaxID=1882483 RepID=A0A317XTB4_9BASI|nr:hypothetical protein BCV70DRAFT_90358 [Testicularia cyperi]